jgi:hypothetical protein
MLGADPPAILRLFSLGHRGDQLLTILDDRIVAIRNCFGAHALRLGSATSLG